MAVGGSGRRERVGDPLHPNREWIKYNTLVYPYSGRMCSSGRRYNVAQTHHADSKKPTLRHYGVNVM